MREIKKGDKYLCKADDYDKGYFTKGKIYDVKRVDEFGISFITDGKGAFTMFHSVLQKDFTDLQEESKSEISTPKNDAIVSSVMFQLAQRSILGQQKYGTTLQENNNDDFLQHLKEELMDAILYIEKLQTLKNIIK